MKTKIILLSAFAIILSSCGNDEKKEEVAKEVIPEVAEEVTPEVTEEVVVPEEPKKQADYLPNEEIVTETGLTVTFLQMAADTKLGYYDKADEGMLIRSVEVLVVNNTEEEVEVSPYDFVLEDGKGENYSQDFTQGKEPSLSDEAIRPGKKRQGWVEFTQVPEDAEGFTVVYSPDGETFYIEFE
jgi:hypothetical protein